MNADIDIYLCKDEENQSFFHHFSLPSLKENQLNNIHFYCRNTICNGLERKKPFVFFCTDLSVLNRGCLSRLVCAMKKQEVELSFSKGLFIDFKGENKEIGIKGKKHQDFPVFLTNSDAFYPYYCRHSHLSFSTIVSTYFMTSSSYCHIESSLFMQFDTHFGSFIDS